MFVSRFGTSNVAERVLLIGSQWDSLSANLKSLAGQGEVTFVGPSDHGSPEIVSLVDPTVIMVCPGCDSGQALPRPDLESDDATEMPPVLVCVTAEELEHGTTLSESDEVADFLVVPCSVAELQWRLRRLFRKSATGPTGAVLEVGRITLDPDAYQVRLTGRVVPMAWMEFQLLKFLMENVGRVFTRGALLSTVWGFDSIGGTRTVDVHIRKLRSKLEVHGERYFRTVKNVGYGMVDPSASALSN
ncbi:MAG: response regulator transcription factor [Chloroflexota bacterium]|nr:response regulator transcription factor [Chloroflexota bacterium]